MKRHSQWLLDRPRHSQGYAHFEVRSRADFRPDLHMSANRLHTLGHAHQAEAVRPRVVDAESDAVIRHR